MILNKILGQSAFWMVNKAIAKEIGIEGALMLSDLLDKQGYFHTRGELDEDGFFFNTSVDIEANTTLTYHIQKQCLKAMKERGFVETKLKGLPAKLHFKVIEIKILNFLNTGIPLIEDPDLKGFEVNNNKLNNNKDNNSLGFGETPTLFPGEEIPKIEDPKARKSMFENSDVYKDPIVKAKEFKAATEAGVDVEYYFEVVKDWNLKKEVKRTSRGWAATVRDFMRGDNEDKKLKFVDGRQQSDKQKDDDDDREYLNM